MGEVLAMKETNMIQSGSLVGRERVDHEGHQPDPEREPCRGEGVWTMKDKNIIQSGSLVGGGSVDHEGHQHHPEREPSRTGKC